MEQDTSEQFAKIGQDGARVRVLRKIGSRQVHS
jgi:hypothetical protein